MFRFDPQAWAESIERLRRALAGMTFRCGLAAAAFDPTLDVQLVTTNEGRCRVVVRRLGGWA